MENMIFNELLFRGYNVDVEMVEVREKDKCILTEVDFICNKGNKKIYIQSSLNLAIKEKTKQESRSLININDSFKKIIIVKDNIKMWQTEEGIVVMGILDFLLNNDSLNF